MIICPSAYISIASECHMASSSLRQVPASFLRALELKRKKYFTPSGKIPWSSKPDPSELWFVCRQFHGGIFIFKNGYRRRYLKPYKLRTCYDGFSTRSRDENNTIQLLYQVSFQSPSTAICYLKAWISVPEWPFTIYFPWNQRNTSIDFIH